MTREEILKFIEEVEDLFPVKDWKVNNIRVWPKIRSNIGGYFFYKENSLEPELVIKKTKIKKSFLPKLVKSVYRLFLLYLKIFQGLDYLFVSAVSHRAKVNGVWFNRFCDSLIDKFKATKKCILLEYKGNIEYKYPRYNNEFVFQLNDIILILEIIFKIKGSKRQIELDKYEEFLIFIKEKGFLELSNKLSAPNIVSQIRVLEPYISLFNFILKVSQPKSVISVCYYSTEGISMDIAAYNNKIPVIEIQHGIQGEYHIAYSKFTSIPNEGYEMLPKVFWNWDETSSKQINLWAKNTNGHFGFTGGNIWIEDWKDANWVERIVGNGLELKNRKKIILYSLQPIKNLFPGFIINAIKNTSNDFEWWLRIHPRQIDHVEELSSFLDSNGIRDFTNIIDATRLPLPLLLSETVLHITNWSSVVLEAEDYEVPSILIHENGYSIFREKIAEGISFFYDVNSQSNLEELIYKVYIRKREVKNMKERKYFEKFIELEQLLQNEKK